MSLSLFSPASRLYIHSGVLSAILQHLFETSLVFEILQFRTPASGAGIGMGRVGLTTACCAAMHGGTGATSGGGPRICAGWETYIFYYTCGEKVVQK